ncbi:MAG: riboflavin synthase [Bdellovibrionaceae bacterium]|nr:riboflavin synthase [Pseudobdellovibrionaceae bacterium]
MFTGIVETQSEIIEVQAGSQCLQISIKKPNSFNDLKVGDSIAVNGVCLTLENFDQNSMKFTIAAETLKITGWTAEKLINLGSLNLERSMLASDRIHGHFVLGHVDGMAKVKEKRPEGQAMIYKIQLPEEFQTFVWSKGSLSLNGVSLTINSFENSTVEVCLIPETLKRTNLTKLNKGDFLTFEIDAMARSFVHLWKMEKQNVQV